MTRIKNDCLHVFNRKDQLPLTNFKDFCNSDRNFTIAIFNLFIILQTNNQKIYLINFAVFGDQTCIDVGWG